MTDEKRGSDDGMPSATDLSRRDFVAQCSLPAEEFFADSFLTEADKAPAAAAAS